MKGLVVWPFLFYISLVVCLFVPDLIIYGTKVYRADSLVEMTVKEGEMKGGLTPEVQAQFYKQLENYGLDKDEKGYKVDFDNPGQITRMDKFSVNFETQYTFTTFNLLGTGIGQFTLPIKSIDSGINEVWLR